MADIDEKDVEVGQPKQSAAGIPGIAVAMKRTIDSMGVTRTARSLLKLNQVDGFDCQGCAWPDPDPSHRHTAEFCENGAKAVAEEATTEHLMPHFFEQNSIEDLRNHTDYWLGHQGRLIHPVVRRRDAEHYEPISWEEAFDLIGETLRGLDSPDEAIFYTSGKTSNEAAYAYQLFARAYGTNNLPDCSNMCHESTSAALAETIGIGKGSVSLEDVYEAELIVVSGQNPGTNHPRMLSALEIAKKNGAKIISINPLPEAGLIRFKNPQNVRGLAGPGTGLSDLHLPVRINGDLALWQAFGALILEAEEAAGNDGSVLDLDFIERHTTGFGDWAREIKNLDWDRVEESTGLTREQIREAADMMLASEATVHCWAMGITQHRNAVATIKEFVNVAMLQGNIGKPGAGLCPVRGHSNVQGDRTMGIWEKVPTHFLDAIRDEYGFDPPRENGHDTVDAIRALRDGKAKVFVAMGGNFVSAAPDTVVTEEAMEKAELTVHVSTKLNRSHVRCGHTSLILPALGRSERDDTGARQPAGHRRGLDVGGARLARAAQAGEQVPAVRGRHRVQHRRGHPGHRRTGPVVGVPQGLREHPQGDLPRGPRLRGVRREGEPARWVRAPAPAPRLPHLPDRVRTGDLHRQPDGRARTCPRAGCSCRACAATTSSTPRSTASATATAGSPAADGWCSCTATTSRRSATRRATSSTWSASGRTAPSARCPRSGSWSTTPRAVARRRTTRRSTRSSPRLDRRRAATPRPRSR